jgi:outer membrane cobalamin receptor
MGSRLNKILFLSVFFVFVLVSAYGQSLVLTGYVNDSGNGEALVGATIWNITGKYGVVTNNYGYFQMHIDASVQHLVIKYVGFNEKKIDLKVLNDTMMVIQLESDNLLGEVTVTDYSNKQFLMTAVPGFHRLSSNEIKRIPSILGEADLFKAIQMLPGVSMTTEGKAAVSVRGGSPDQTLVLLDGVPVYNVNHLFGYLSTFNPDAINSAALYKGALPARFGGRLSSVLDVATKEGNLFNKSKSISLGTMAGRVYLEGPLIENVVSYSFAYRRTWFDLPLRFVQWMNYSQQISYGFWDFNGKVNWKVNNKNALFLSLYRGKDIFRLKDEASLRESTDIDFNYNWQNVTAVFRWNHIANSRLFINTSIYNSNYLQEQKSVTDKANNNYYRSFNGLTDWSIKTDFNYSPTIKHQIKFGYHISLQQFTPEISEMNTTDTLIVQNTDSHIENSTIAFYVDDEFTVSKKSALNYGARFSFYSVEDKMYSGIEPRISYNYNIHSDLSLKASYSHMKQFLHMLTSQSVNVPLEMWFPSTKRVEPSNSDLFSVGLFYYINNGMRVSIEAYYTAMNNVLQYVEGVNFYRQAGYTWEDYVVQGKGKSKGLELLFEKDSGRLTGWASYSLSKSDRTFTSLNFGNPFPYDYDRRHQFKVFGNYDISSKQYKGKTTNQKLAFNFVYLSGHYISFPYLNMLPCLCLMINSSFMIYLFNTSKPKII